MDVSNLTIEKDGKTILSDISFSLEKESTLFILCPNNGGKTTLIRALSGITNDGIGKTIVNDVVLSKKNFKEYMLQISTVLEDIDNQFLCFKVNDELRFPLDNLKYKEREIKNIIENISELLEIKTILGKDVSRLTMFEKVKVLIGASIVHSPKVLLIDDVLRFLNNNEKNDLLKLFKIINSKLNISIVYTTSDLNDVIKSQNILLINEGKVVTQDSFSNIILQDNELTKMGFNIPIMIDLSRKLQFYNLVDEIYLDKDKMVDALWK